MEQREFEEFLKDWQKMLENSYEVMCQVGVISNSIANNIEEIMKGVELKFEPIRIFLSENERIFEGAMGSIRGISDAIRKAQKNFRVPETMAENIRKFAEGLTQQMKPIIKSLGEWQKLTEGWK